MLCCAEQKSPCSAQRSGVRGSNLVGCRLQVGWLLRGLSNLAARPAHTVSVPPTQQRHTHSPWASIQWRPPHSHPPRPTGAQLCLWAQLRAILGQVIVFCSTGN